MDFDREGLEATSEVMALATICEQTPMGEVGNGAFVFAFDKGEGGAVRPGESNVGFTLVDVSQGLQSDLATNVMVSKILTSGQIFDKNGYLNNQLETSIDNQAGQVGSIGGLRTINACNPQVGKVQVRELNEVLVNSLAQSDDWAQNFVERARVLRDMSMTTSNAFVHGAVQKLGEYVQIARDVSKKKTIDNINENVQSR